MARLRGSVRRHWRRWAAAGLVFGGVATFVLIYFAPQDLLLDTSVNESLPTAKALMTPPVAPTVSLADGVGASSVRPSSTPPAALRVLARGRFHSGEHHTSGDALVLRLADGATYVRLQHFVTSNGPDVRIWLSTADPHASDDAVEQARHLDLGGLKANHGNQNYRVRDRIAPCTYRSVVVWCRRFHVVFGAAPARL